MIDHLLWVDNKGLHAYRQRGGKLQRERAFSTDDASLEAFAVYLAALGRAPLAMLVNSTDETYAHDTIPRLGKRDRRALVERKCQQHFPNNDFVTAVSHACDEHGEHIAIAALAGDAVLTPWLQRIDLAGSRLCGIYTLAQIAPLLWRRLRLDHAPCLLLVVLTQSIREIFMVNRRVCFSRQIGIRDVNSISEQQLAGEAQALHQYLLGRQLIGRDTPLPIYLLPAPSENASEAILTNETFHRLDPDKIAALLKLNPSPFPWNNETIFLALLARQRPTEQLAPTRICHAYRYGQLGRLLTGVGIGLLLGSLFFAAGKLHQTQAREQQIDVLKSSLRRLADERKTLDTRLPGLDIDPAALLELDAQYRRLQQGPATPEASYRLLGRLLALHNTVAIDSIEWRNDNTPLAPGPETLLLHGKSPEPGKLDAFVQSLKQEAGFVADREPGTRTDFQLRLHRDKAS